MGVHTFMRKYKPIQGQEIQCVLLSTPCIQQTAATVLGKIFHILTKNDFVFHNNDL